MNVELVKTFISDIKDENPKVATQLSEMLHLVSEGNCPFCKKPGPFEFKNELSQKEFKISGLCQSCQDKFFK
jgi:hypothetical protein